MLKFNFENSSITDKMINAYSEKVAEIHKELNKVANDEKEYVGWLELPTNYDKEEFARIKKQQKNSKRFRSFSCNWNWWILFRSKSCYRSVITFFL